MLEVENITVRANMWITDLAFDGSVSQISFQTHGPPDGIVQASIGIPKELLSGPFVVHIDGQPHDFTESEDESETTLTFQFDQGLHYVEVWQQ